MVIKYTRNANTHFMAFAASFAFVCALLQESYFSTTPLTQGSNKVCNTYVNLQPPEATYELITINCKVQVPVKK